MDNISEILLNIIFRKYVSVSHGLNDDRLFLSIISWKMGKFQIFSGNLLHDNAPQDESENFVLVRHFFGMI